MYVNRTFCYNQSFAFYRICYITMNISIRIFISITSIIILIDFCYSPSNIFGKCSCSYYRLITNIFIIFCTCIKTYVWGSQISFSSRSYIKISTFISFLIFTYESIFSTLKICICTRLNT